MSSPHRIDPPASSGWVRFLLHNFVVYNPLFLFSAMAVLGSAWTLNPAAEGGGRGLPRLLQLFAVIQAYELTLLGAAWLLARRGDLARDVRNLHLVLAPFLLDVTFTTSSLVVTSLNTAGASLAFPLAGITLGLAAIKVHVGLRLCGLTLDEPRRLVLVAGTALTLVTPIVGSALAFSGDAPLVGLVAGGGAALLALAFGAGAGGERGAPLRALAPLVLTAALVHGCATAYAYTSPLPWVLGPLLLGLAPVVHRLAPGLVTAHAPAVSALAAAGALCCALPEQGGARGVAQLGLGAFSLLAGVSFARTRALGHLLALLLGLRFLAGAGSLGATLSQLGTSSVEPALLLSLFGYGLWRRSHPLACALPLALAALLIVRQHFLGGTALDLVLGVQVLGAGVLAFAHRHHGNAASGAQHRFWGALLLYAPAAVAALVAEPAAIAAWMSRGALVALLALAAVTRLRAYALPALLLPLELAAHSVPRSAQAWGVLGLVGAFGVLGLGVTVSLRREQLLDWLARSAEERARRPEHAGRAAGKALEGLIALGALVALAAILIPNVSCHGHSPRSAAIGNLKTIAAAQAIYAETHAGRCAGSLRELGEVGYVDALLADGRKSRYRFELQRSSSDARRWVAVASPEDLHASARGPKGITAPAHFAIDDRGDLVMSDAPVTPAPGAPLPAALQRVR